MQPQEKASHCSRTYSSLNPLTYFLPICRKIWLKTVERYAIWFVFLIVYSGGNFWCPYWNWFAIKTKTTFLKMKEIASTNPHLELDLCQYAFPFYVIEIVFCIVICLYQCIQIIVSFAQCTLSKANVLVSFLLTFWD